MKDPLVSQIRTGCKYGPMSSTLEKQKGIHISFDRNCNVCHVTIMLVGHPPLKLEYLPGPGILLGFIDQFYSSFCFKICRGKWW